MAITLDGTNGIDSPDLNITGTGARITGDFNNATVANRVAFQTSTANATTQLHTIPNGTSTNAGFGAFNNSDPTNASELIGTISATESRFQSTVRGTGTYLPMTFYTGGSEKLRILTSGGITFNGDTASANALDDYEEGTFTPTDASGAGLTLGATTSARYVKIGKRVFCDIEVVYPSTSDTNGVTVGGLPFTSANDGNYASSACMNNANLNLWAFITLNVTFMTVYKQAASYTLATNADVSARALYISIAYDVA